MSKIEDKNGDEKATQSDAHVDLARIKTRVDKIHVEGLGRTKDDLVIKNISELFVAKDFQQVVLKSQEVRVKLEQLGCFKSVGVFIDTSKGPDSYENGLEITFTVKELKRLLGGINTLVGNNEGSLVIGANLPNTLGRGEKLQAEYTYGTKQSRGFNGTFIKPLHNKASTIFTTSLFQQNSEWPTSGYHLLENGLSFDTSFDSVPMLRHHLQWEGVWRELSCLTRTTTFPVREQAGHSLKSSLRHITQFDNRDSPVFPKHGTLFRMAQELAGLGGDVGFVKHEINYQVNVPIIDDVIVQGSFQGGLMKKLNDEKLIYICDRFFLGGPHSIRGFEHRGIGPHSDSQALGALGYWAAGLHLFTPLPFRPGRGGLNEILKAHFFVNAGNIDNFEPRNGWRESALSLLNNYRLSYGCGIMLRLGSAARVELNYCVPLRSERGDRARQGVQVAVGVQFL